MDLTDQGLLTHGSTLKVSFGHELIFQEIGSSGDMFEYQVFISNGFDSTLTFIIAANPCVLRFQFLDASIKMDSAKQESGLLYMPSPVLEKIFSFISVKEAQDCFLMTSRAAMDSLKGQLQSEKIVVDGTMDNLRQCLLVTPGSVRCVEVEPSYFVKSFEVYNREEWKAVLSGKNLKRVHVQNFDDLVGVKFNSSTRLSYFRLSIPEMNLDECKRISKEDPDLLASLVATKVKNVLVKVHRDYLEEKHGPVFEILQSLFPHATEMEIHLGYDDGYLVVPTLRPTKILKNFSLLVNVHRPLYDQAASSPRMPLENLTGLEGLLCHPFLLLWLFSQSTVWMPKLTTLMIKDEWHRCPESIWANLPRFAPNVSKFHLNDYLLDYLHELLCVRHP